MLKRSLLGQVHSDQKQFSSISPREQIYSQKEVSSVGGASPGSSFAASIETRNLTRRQA
jgi:hypothetical protein